MSLKQRIDAFFHPTQVKINPAYAGLIQYGDVPKPVQMPKNYKSYAKEGYRNDTVFKCISYIARNGAAIPPVLYEDATKKKRIDDHPLLDKLNKPNNEQSGVAYREAALAYKLLAGNSYQYSIRAKGAEPDELWVLRPDYVQIIPSKKRGIVGYKYEFIETPIAPENVGHTKYFSPDNDLYGLSPIEVAAVLIDQQKAAKLWNLALLQNSARPPGAWTVPTALSKNDRERLEQKLKEKLQGYKNAGSPPVLDAGLKWESMGLPPAQLDYLEGMQYNAANIANIFNIPPQIIGDTSASTYNNMEQAKAASYTEAIFPELDDLYAMWNSWLLPMYPDLDGAYLTYDKESVEVLQAIIQAQKDAQEARATEMWNSGMCTLNEARDRCGLQKVEYGEIYKLGNVIVPADSIQLYALQSLTTPAAPPVPQAEPLNVAPPDNETQTSEDNNKQEEKHLDRHGVYQPDNLQDQLKALRAEGVKYVRWKSSRDACDICQLNDAQVVELGQPFVSGHILPVVHPNCGCVVIAYQEKPKSLDNRTSYREFRRGYEDALTA